MKTRGFTILELIIVIVILGILVTLGINNYIFVIEKSRGVEARQHLGAISMAEIVYYQENG
jgi:prepilin-type N-terminal cleavage/methylation domain-containing protein